MTSTYSVAKLTGGAANSVGRTVVLEHQGHDQYHVDAVHLHRGCAKEPAGKCDAWFLLHPKHPVCQAASVRMIGNISTSPTAARPRAAMMPSAVSALRIAWPSLSRRPAHRCRPASWKPVIPRQVLRSFLLHAHRRCAYLSAGRAPWIPSPAHGVQTREPAFASTVLVLAACLTHDLPPCRARRGPGARSRPALGRRRVPGSRAPT